MHIPDGARLYGDIVEALLAADAPAEICVRWAQADCVNQRKLTDMCAGWDDDEGRLAAVKEITRHPAGLISGGYAHEGRRLEKLDGSQRCAAC